MDQSPQECGTVPRLEPVPCSGRRFERSLLGWITSSRWPVILLAACILLVPLVWAQEASKGARREGDLQTFINPEASDLNTKLEVLQQTLYEVNQKLTNLTFMQRNGDRIRMERVMYANSDHGLTPAYVFTPAGAEKEKRYPGLVAVHGGYHFSLDEEFFGFIERAVAEGYVLIFPEYRGSRGYGAEHYKAQDYGGKDVTDVLDAADYLASRAAVDPARLGIMGRSRGGMIALLAIERSPKKFRAAVDVVGITDFVAYMSYKPEYRRAGRGQDAPIRRHALRKPAGVHGSLAAGPRGQDRDAAAHPRDDVRPNRPDAAPHGALDRRAEGPGEELRGQDLRPARLAVMGSARATPSPAGTRPTESSPSWRNISNRNEESTTS